MAGRGKGGGESGGEDGSGVRVSLGLSIGGACCVQVPCSSGIGKGLTINTWKRKG